MLRSTSIRQVGADLHRVDPENEYRWLAAAADTQDVNAPRDSSLPSPDDRTTALDDGVSLGCHPRFDLCCS